MIALAIQSLRALALLSFAVLPTQDGAGTARPEPEAREVRDQESEAAAGAIEMVRYEAPASYESLEQSAERIARWIAESSGEIRSIALPRTRGGFEVSAFEWGTPGRIPLEERPTVLLLGGLDGRSFAGSIAALRAASSLLADPVGLPAELTFVCIPWAAPDGLVRAYQGRGDDGRNGRRGDADGDGELDEDGPDDLDGDGSILDMLLEDEQGPWILNSPDPAQYPRFLVPARAGDSPRYRLVREGADEDGDGRFNEDGAEGVVLDANFPLGWLPSGREGASGPWPLSEPLGLAIARLCLDRKTQLVLSFQGNHGRLAHPGGTATALVSWPPLADAATWDFGARLFAKATGRDADSVSLLQARGEPGLGGAALDWFYTVPGCAAFEYAAWGPPTSEDESSDSGAWDRIRPADRAWARWLANERGGVGFSDWSPVEVGDLGQALVGGWQPRSRFNPPDDELENSLRGVESFTREMVSGLPRLEIRLSSPVRDGRLVRLRGRVENAGGIATELWPHRAREAGARARLELSVPAGVRLLAGELSIELPPIAGGGASPTYEWVLLAPAGSVLGFSASSEFFQTVELEVRP